MTALPFLAAAEVTAEAESAAMTAEAGAPSLTALYDALGYAHAALGAALGLTTGFPSSSLIEASIAAAEAFPLGTPQSESLGCILDVIDGVTCERAA